VIASNKHVLQKKIYQNREIARSSFDSQLHFPHLVKRGKSMEKLENENNKMVLIQSEIIK
jgi:hypothetical protein